MCREANYRSMDVGLKIERPYGPGIRVTWPKTQGGSRSIRMDEVPRGVRTAVAVAVSERSFAFFARPLQARPGLCYYTTLHSTKLMGVAVTLRLDSAYNRRAAAIEVGSGSRVTTILTADVRDFTSRIVLFAPGTSSPEEAARFIPERASQFYAS